MFKRLTKFAQTAVVAVGFVVGGAALPVTAANAATIDTTAAIASIGDAGTATLAIGAAVFTVFVGLKLYKWLRQAL